MRSGMLALSAPDGGTLVAWKHDGQTWWQICPIDCTRSRNPNVGAPVKIAGERDEAFPLPRLDGTAWGSQSTRRLATGKLGRAAYQLMVPCSTIP